MPRKAKTKTSPPKSAPRSKAAMAADLAGIEKASYDRREFCGRHGLSLGTYTKLQAGGLGPREMKPSGKSHGVRRISREAEAEWIAASEGREITKTERKSAAAKRGE
jgi:hypothetical protein